MPTISFCISFCSKDKYHIKNQPIENRKFHIYIHINRKNWNAAVEIEFKKFKPNYLLTDLNNDQNPLISIPLN